MQYVLTQHKCSQSLKCEVAMSPNLTQAQKTDMIDKEKSFIVLCLVHNV